MLPQLTVEERLVFGFVSFQQNANDTETCLRATPPFSKPSTYLESVLPFDYHMSVTFALGVTKVSDLSLGRTSVSVFGARNTKTE